MKNNLYEGYLWYSNEKTPRVLNGEPWSEAELDASKNPFIIEGQLYDKENLISYSIKYVDGQYFCKKYELKETDFNDIDIDDIDKVSFKAHRIGKVSFKAHRMGKGTVLEFLQYYREEVDTECEGMKVLVPAEKVFIGLKENKEE